MRGKTPLRDWSTYGAFVHVDFGDLRGFVLWAPRADGIDRVFAERGRIPVFASTRLLLAHIRGSERSTLDGSTWYRALKRRGIRGVAKSSVDRSLRVSFKDVIKVIADADRGLSLSECSEIVNAVNIIGDIGASMDDDVVRERLFGDNTETAKFVNDISAIDARSASVVLLRYEAEVLCDQIADLIARVRRAMYEVSVRGTTANARSRRAGPRAT